MYRKLFILAAIALSFISCSKEMDVEEVQMCFCATIQPEIRASLRSPEPAEVQADHAVLEVWYRDTRELRQEQTLTPGTTSVIFSDVRLVAGFDYDVYVWVDNSGYYSTGDLRTVSLASEKMYGGDDSKYDAFYAYKQIQCRQNCTVDPITLKRPFAKLCFSAQVDKEVTISFSAATSLDLKTGKVSEQKTAFSYTIQPGEGSVSAFDYVFADEGLSHMDYSFKFEGAEQGTTTAVPVERNVKTNIIYSVTH